MKKILVAIDFSPASGNAYEYAQWLSLDLGASLSVLFVNTATKAEETVTEKQRQAMVKRENEEYRERLKSFTMNYPHHDPNETLIKVAPKGYLVANGRISTEIANTAQKIGSELIVLGIRSKHLLQEHLFGSVSTHLIGKTPCPLLLIPEAANYKPLRHIALAIDLSLNEAVIPSGLKNLAKALNAKIDPFYVNMLPEDPDKSKSEQLKSGQTEVTMIREKSVKSGIFYYLKNNPVDLLALYLPQRAFPDNLLHGRLARHMAWHSPAPLLLLRERGFDY